MENNKVTALVKKEHGDKFDKHLNLDDLNPQDRQKIIDYLSLRMISYVHAKCKPKMAELLDKLQPRTIEPELHVHVDFEITVTGESLIEALGFARLFGGIDGKQ